LFDVPIIDKEWISIPKHTVYYCINPKEKNNNETRISRDMAKIEDKPYLCDYDCVKESSGKNRLFNVYKRVR